MNEETVSVMVTIMDKEYCIACPVEEKEALIQSARMLNRQIESLQHNSTIMGSERLAVMAGLHIANELLQYKKNQQDRRKGLQQRLQSIHDRIDKALSEKTELFL